MGVCLVCVCVLGWGGGIETHLWTLNSKSSWNCYCYKNHIFQCMCMICLCGILLVHLKFRAKYLAHTLKYRHFIQILLRCQAIGALGFKSSQVFLKCHVIGCWYEQNHGLAMEEEGINANMCQQPIAIYLVGFIVCIPIIRQWSVCFHIIYF